MADLRVSLLDVGPEEYGDAVLCDFDGTTVLIDGAHTGDHTGREGHPSIPEQLASLLDQPRSSLSIDLLVVTHAHEDHIGCLPRLVDDDILRADWALVADPRLGWGRAVDEAPDAVDLSEPARVLAAALREEIRTPGTDDRTLVEFFRDASTLEDRYTAMLDTLEARGTRVIRYGRDDPEGLLETFKSIGIEILGPSEGHLLTCAERLSRQAQDAIDYVTDVMNLDLAVDLVATYRALVDDHRDAIDSVRQGAVVNLQSLVTAFSFGGLSFLFAGDMQFEDPGVSDPAIRSGVAALRGAIRERAPWSFVKLSHHGSFNAFSATVLEELGSTPLFGICAGEHSRKHPDSGVLKLLDDHASDLQWARTDRNGQSTIEFSNGESTIAVSKGNVNDPRPNSLDDLPVTGEETTEPGLAETRTSQEVNKSFIEVRIPHVRTHVSFSVDIDPTEASPRLDDLAVPEEAVRRRVDLPPLLFVTSGHALARNIGEREARSVLDVLEEIGSESLDLGPEAVEAGRAAASVTLALARNPDIQGIVIVGGYDVVPAQRVDCLPPALRRQVGGADDPDNFIVWSDDVYGDADGDGLPEKPVSRIPDGRSSALLVSALQPRGANSLSGRVGVRNVARPFADQIYHALPGDREIVVSEPAVFDASPPIKLDAQRVYLMLHGDFVDSSRFWGEDTPGNREAVNVGNIPSKTAGIVFTGCCWGALICDTPAGRVVPRRPFGHKVPESSIALTFLARGARAFVGCTGAHYSPTEPPYGYFGGPLHQAFWASIEAGSAPAMALFDAKQDYVVGIPHGNPTPTAQAIELKIWRQYTCLGLGW